MKLFNMENNLFWSFFRMIDYFHHEGKFQLILNLNFRELSTLRYERSEDQRSLTELRRKLDTEQEENRRIIEREKEEKRAEIQEMARKHQRELEDLRREADRSADLLNGIREQQGFTIDYFVMKII